MVSKATRSSSDQSFFSRSWENPMMAASGLLSSCATPASAVPKLAIRNSDARWVSSGASTRSESGGGGVGALAIEKDESTRLDQGGLASVEPGWPSARPAPS